MFNHHRLTRPLWYWVIIAALGGTLGRPAPAQAQAPGAQAPGPGPADPAAAEEAREQHAMERFLSILEKSPRRGTPLDRVYGYHVERGSIDAFIKSARDRLAKNPTDGTGWLILGLLEFQRGQDAAAVDAFKKAETARADDPLPAYYLGQALVLVGQPEQAAAAFERALCASPPATTSSKSSRPWAASTSAPRKMTRPSRSGTGLKPSSPTTRESRSRSRWHSPKKTSLRWPCRGSRPWRRRPPIRSARSSSPCRPPT